MLVMDWRKRALRTKYRILEGELSKESATEKKVGGVVAWRAPLKR